MDFIYILSRLARILEKRQRDIGIQKTQKKHRGPYRWKGHKGDLPKLHANSKGAITRAVLVPHLKVSDLKGHALMIHAGGDNYSDTPKKLGGGGPRIACGQGQASIIHR